MRFEVWFEVHQWSKVEIEKEGPQVEERILPQKPKAVSGRTERSMSSVRSEHPDSSQEPNPVRKRGRGAEVLPEGLRAPQVGGVVRHPVGVAMLEGGRAAEGERQTDRHRLML